MAVGLLVPFVTGLLVKKSFASWLKFLVALITSAVVGIGAVAIAGDFNLGSGYTVATIGAVIGASQASFWFILTRVPGLKDWLMSQFVKDDPAAPPVT
jgi:hypothetical protein